MKVSKYTRLGFLVVISATILIWGLSYLKGNDIFRNMDEYYVVYDRVDGLSKSNDVILSGYKIGQVNEIRFLDDNSGRLLVSFIIDSSIEIPVNSIAQIISSDLMGTRAIRINFSDAGQYYSEYDTIPGAVERDLKEEVSMQVLPIKNKAEELLGTLDSAITVLTVIFNEEARQNLSESFVNINQTINNIEQITADLQEIISFEKQSVENIISNLDTITTGISRNTQHFDEIIQNLTAISDSLAQLPVSPLFNNIRDITNQISAMLSKLESNDNTAGLLLNDDELYKRITGLSASMNLLMNDIRANPQRYLNFSAIDLGKKVYVNPTGDASSNIVFKVHLISSEKPIPLNSEIFEGLRPIEEYEASGAYTYLTGTTNSFGEIMEIQEKALDSFPDASIVAFRNGRLIKLERALKSLE